MKLVFDIETDDLNASKIWCIVAIDEDNKVYSYKPGQIEEGIKLLESAETLIGHNILGFDIPVIKDLYDVDLYNKNIVDTLVVSRLINPTKEKGHSLKNWGFTLGQYKGEPPEDFTEYSNEMLEYCIQDVKLNKKLYNHLQQHVKGFSKESLQLEHEVFKIIVQQRKDGFKLDMHKSMALLSTLAERRKEVEEEVHQTFKPKWKEIKTVTPKIKKDGELSKQGLTEHEYKSLQEKFKNIPMEEGYSFVRKELVDFNLGSRKQIGEYLIDFGWKPERFTPTGQPIVDEGTLKKIDHIHEANLIAEFLLLQKRIAQIQSWIDAVGDDGRVHGGVISNGAITGRMTHNNPNMAQVPSIHNQYGKECRWCWTVEEGNKLVGIDASQLELRLLAHYMADKEYINEILHGDIHTTNQKLAGLESRDQAKTFIYALIYGAGDEKIGKIIGGSREEGQRMREHFLNSLPSFNNLKARVESATRKGFLKGLDGRKIKLRHKHAALNTLLQSGGAIVMKRALTKLVSSLQLNTIPYKIVANVHDEWQIEAPEKNADFVGDRGVLAIRETADYYNMRCPLDGEYKVGGNWSETH